MGSIDASIATQQTAGFRAYEQGLTDVFRIWWEEHKLAVNGQEPIPKESRTSLREILEASMVQTWWKFITKQDHATYVDKKIREVDLVVRTSPYCRVAVPHGFPTLRTIGEKGLLTAVRVALKLKETYAREPRKYLTATATLGHVSLSHLGATKAAIGVMEGPTYMDPVDIDLIDRDSPKGLDMEVAKRLGHGKARGCPVFKKPSQDCFEYLQATYGVDSRAPMGVELILWLGDAYERFEAQKTATNQPEPRYRKQV